MDLQTEWIEWSRKGGWWAWTEKDMFGGQHPNAELKPNHIRVTYCYYSRKASASAAAPRAFKIDVSGGN